MLYVPGLLMDPESFPCILKPYYALLQTLGYLYVLASSAVFIYFQTIDGNIKLHLSYDCLLRNTTEKCSLNRFRAHNFCPRSVNYPLLNLLNIST